MFAISGLTSVIIPSTITSFGLIVVVIIFIVLLLGNRAFASPNLLSVELTNGLVGLGFEMFSYSGLTSVIIPSTITSFGLIVIAIIFIDIFYLYDFITKSIIHFMTKYYNIFIIYYHF
jgi:hypothetical protein